MSNYTKLEEHLKKRQQIVWAINPPPQIVKKKNTTIEAQRLQAKNKEMIWGNKMIGQEKNTQWTTLLGENLVHHVLYILGEKPEKVNKKQGFQPDRSTESRIIEVKTRNWNTGGTAGEKVYGTCIKYQDIPELYGKPLHIVCVAFQEYELEFGKLKFFGDNVSSKTKEILNISKTWNIEYVKFSDLISPLLNYELSPLNAQL